MKYREMITALKTILMKAFRIGSSVLTTELRVALNKVRVFIKREAYQRTERRHFKTILEI